MKEPQPKFYKDFTELRDDVDNPSADVDTYEIPRYAVDGSSPE